MHLRRSLAIMLLLMFTTGLAVSTFTTAAQTATPTPLSPPTATVVPPTALPTPTVFATPAGCATPLSIPHGSLAFLKGGVNIRNIPSVSGGQVGYFQDSVTVRVLDGPICADGYNWWQVDAPGNNGWVAEGKPGRYWLFPAPPPEGTVCRTPIALTIGGTVRLVTGSRVRQDPNINGLVLTVAPQDAVLEVIDGPTCADGTNWWKVRVPFSGLIVEGWIAEGTGDDFWLASTVVVEIEECAPPIRRLAPGDRAYLSYPVGDSPKNLRSEPSINAPVLETLLDGIAFEILEGPVCNDGYNWWYISITTRPDVTGWLADGGRWIRRFDSRF